jgi:hypothetical protein
MRRLRSVLSMLKTRSRQVQECSAPAAGAQGNGGAQRTMPSGDELARLATDGG